MVGVAACKQSVLIQCTGIVSEQSMGWGPRSPKVGSLDLLEPQFPHLSMGVLDHFDFGGPPVFYILWLFMKTVILGLKHT